MKQSSIGLDNRDASLRISKRVRDQLKMAAAVLGRPLYDITNEAMEKYLAGVKLSGPSASILRAEHAKGS